MRRRSSTRSRSFSTSQWLGVPVVLLIITLLWLPSNAFSLRPPRPRTALVTGANTGIGKEIVRQLSQQSESEPWLILLGCRNLEEGEIALANIMEDATPGTRVVCVPLDLTDIQSVKAAAAFVADETGGYLDVLVNNAAICFNSPTLYGRVEHTPFERQAYITIRTNFFGTLDVIDAMFPLLIKSEAPRVINMASAVGRLEALQNDELYDVFASPEMSIEELSDLMRQFVEDAENGCHLEAGWPDSCYATSKLGVLALTQVLARDYPTLQINAVDPGYCATAQNDFQGHKSAAEGAVAAVELATQPFDRFLTGGYFSS